MVSMMGSRLMMTSTELVMIMVMAMISQVSSLKISRLPRIARWIARQFMVILSTLGMQILLRHLGFQDMSTLAVNLLTIQNISSIQSLFPCGKLGESYNLFPATTVVALRLRILQSGSFISGRKGE